MTIKYHGMVKREGEKARKKIEQETNQNDKIKQEVNWDFVAGLYQGEGNSSVKIMKSIGKKTKKTYYGIGFITTIANGDKILMEDIYKFLKQQGITARLRNCKRKDRTRDYYQIDICKKPESKLFLLSISPKLHGEKKEEVEIILNDVFPLLVNGCQGKKGYWDKERVGRLMASVNKINSFHKNGQTLRKYTPAYFRNLELI